MYATQKPSAIKASLALVIYFVEDYILAKTDRLDEWGDCGRKVGRDSRVRKGVRMYDRDVVELALLALEEGMTHAEAA
ncbi:hypothetical protein DMP06_09530, partial [Slackia equolifaciens]